MQQATNSSGDSTLQNQNEIQITLHSTCSSLSNNHNENNVPKEVRIEKIIAEKRGTYKNFYHRMIQSLLLAMV